MSYELNLIGPTEARIAATKLARKHGCEAHDGDDSLQISLQANDDAVARLYRALVKLAREAGGRLHDPQAGTDVNLDAAGRLPPLWLPSGPVPGANYKAKVKHFLTDYLGPDGYSVRDADTAVRSGEHQVQGLHFQAGTGIRSGHFTINLYRTFDFAPLVHPTQMDGVLRTERLVLADRPAWVPGHGWLPSAPAKSLERAFARVQSLFDQTLRPLLDDTRTIGGLVATFEAGRLTAHEAFGHGAENLARCYRHLGRLADGRDRYWALLDELQSSDDPHTVEWAREERDRARPLLDG
jgi:hypothetical protein